MNKLWSDLDFVFVSLMSVLGIIYILQQMGDGLFFDHISVRPTVVIMIKNYQNQIEGIIRNYYKNPKNQRDLWILDNGSKDQTKKILEKISREYPGIRTIFLNDDSEYLCLKKVISNNPAILFIDATNLKYNEVLNLTKNIT